MSDGTRTRDILDHNQVLYQLSYDSTTTGGGTCRFPDRPRRSLQGPKGARAHVFAGTLLARYCAGRTCLAAIDFAVSESGPGCGTKMASR